MKKIYYSMAASSIFVLGLLCGMECGSIEDTFWDIVMIPTYIYISVFYGDVPLF